MLTSLLDSLLPHGFVSGKILEKAYPRASPNVAGCISYFAVEPSVKISRRNREIEKWRYGDMKICLAPCTEECTE